jgi:hypothetical protein
MVIRANVLTPVWEVGCHVRVTHSSTFLINAATIPRVALTRLILGHQDPASV